MKNSPEHSHISSWNGFSDGGGKEQLVEGGFCLLPSKPINHPIDPPLSGSRPAHSEVQMAPESLKETPEGFFAEAAKGPWPVWGKPVK